MAITNRDRRELFDRLEATLGEHTAETLMQLLPNEPADQLVTRTDMHAFGAELRAELRGEMAELRAELRGEMAELRGEMAELRADVQVEISRLHSRISEFTVDIKTHTSRAILGGVVVNVATVLTAVGLA